MTEKGQYPLVYQLEDRNGVLIPVGLAEASSLGSFSAVNIVVSSISATDYLGFEANVSFTGVLSVTSVGTGQPLVSLVDPNNPVIRSLATPTTNFLTPSLAGDGTVNIGYGTDPLGHDHGGTNNYEVPVQDGVAHWFFDGSKYILDTDVDFTFNKTNLSIPPDGKYQIGGNDLKLQDIAGIASPATLNLIPPPTTTNTYLIYNSLGALSWSAVTGTGGGATLPNTPGRIPITNSTTTSLDTDATLTFNTSTKVLSTYTINNVCDVCAIRFNEGGTLLSDKYQGKDDTLTAIAGLNPTTNQLIYFTNTNAAATATVSPCALELLGDSTFADMRTTLELGNIATRSITSPPIGGLYFENDPTGTFSTDVDLTFNTGTNTLKSPVVCATTVCATTIQEGGTSLTSKYKSITDFNTFTGTLGTLAFTGSVNLNSGEVYNTLPVTKGGLGRTTTTVNRILVGGTGNTVDEISTPSTGYLKWNGTTFTWDSPTGTVSLPSDACAVVFMNTTGDALTSNKGIRVNNSASTLEVFSNLADGTGGLDIAPDVANEGFLRWDHNYDTLGIQGVNNTDIALGVDELIPVLNQTGATIHKGQVCYVSGSSGGTYRGKISTLQSNNTTAYIIGVALKNITTTNSGYLIKKGLIKNATLSDIQKSGGEIWAEGDFVYVSDEAGKLTNVPPGIGVHAARVGIVLHMAGSNASIGVNVDRGYDLNELHDVQASPTSDGETLVWNATNSSYVTGTINSITGTLSVGKGGTGATTFTDKGLVYYDGLAIPTPQFISNSQLIFESNVLKSPTVCATVVCATTFNEGGTSLVSKYLTQADAVTNYVNKSTTGSFALTANLGDLAYADQIDVTTTALTGTLTVAKGGTGLTTLTANNFLVGNGTSISLVPTSTYETTANAQATYLGKSTFNSWSGALALSAGLLDVQITSTPSTGQVLKWNGLKWANANDATGTGSPGGSPGGSTTHVQVNYYNGESNVFSGNAGLTYDLTTSTLRAQNWSNLPSGSAYWNANQLSGYPIVSSLAGPGPEPIDNNVLMYLTAGVPTPGWYYATPGGGSPGGSNTQIQFNNSTQFSGSPALTWDNSTSTLISKQLSATTVSAGTIHVGGSDGYIRNNNGSIGISAIGGSVQISGTGSVSLQGIPIDETNWPQAGTGPAVAFYSHTANELLNVRLNSSVINGTRAYDGVVPNQGYIVASYLASANNDYFGINSFWNTPGIPGGAPDLPTNKDVLVYNNDIYGYGFIGSKGWTWEQLSLAGGYLSDVNTANVNTNDTLVYNGTTWTPKVSDGVIKSLITQSFGGF